MTPITCIIVDDEPLAVKLLESFVAKTPQLQLLASFTDSVEALAATAGFIYGQCGSFVLPA